MLYDHKTDRMGGITITRLCDGATRSLQTQDDVEAFQDVAGPLTNDLASLRDGESRERARLRRLLDSYCAEYFEGGE